MIKRAYLGLFAVFLILSPLYVVKSGLPQPADWVMALLIIILSTDLIIRLPVHKDLYLAAGLFLGQVCIVNLFWWSQLNVPRISIYSVFYAFDFGAFVVTMTLIRDFGDRFTRLCRVAAIIAVVVEVGALTLMPSAATFRSEGTTNNPNQLGYWGLLITAFALVLKREQRLDLWDLVLLGGAGYVVAESVSKAALLSFGLLLLLGFVRQRATRPVKAALIGLGFVAVVAAFADPSLVGRFATTGLVGKVSERLNNIGKQSDDSMAGRGYDRIWRYPQYLVFGAGEGAAWRFSGSLANPGIDARELHSTLGTVLFSYGVIGFALFLFLLWVVFRRAPLTHILYSLPLWAYGMVHQGLRETMLWVFLGLVFGLAEYGRPRTLEEERPPPAEAPVGRLGPARGAGRLGPGRAAGLQAGATRAPGR